MYILKIVNGSSNTQRFKDEFKRIIELHHMPLHKLVFDLRKYINLVSNNRDEIELLWDALYLYQTQHEQRKPKTDVELNLYIWSDSNASIILPVS